MRSLFSAVVRPPYVRARHGVRTALFDRRYGVEAEGVVSPADAGVTEPESEDYILRHPFRCPDVQWIRGDARSIELPDTFTVAYLYEPFRGAVFATVVDRLLSSVDRNPRRLRIVYGNPEEEAALLATGRVRLVRETRGWRPGPEWFRWNAFRLYEVMPSR